jgi:hypothetical protein
MIWESLVENGQLFWRCTGGTLPDNLRPEECQN